MYFISTQFIPLLNYVPSYRYNTFLKSHLSADVHFLHIFYPIINKAAIRIYTQNLYRHVFTSLLYIAKIEIVGSYNCLLNLLRNCRVFINMDELFAIPLYYYKNYIILAKAVLWSGYLCPTKYVWKS